MHLRLSSFLLVIAIGTSASAAEMLTGHPIISSTPLIALQNQNCSEDHRIELTDDRGLAIARVCNGTFQLCSIEGSCVIEREDGFRQTISYVRWDKKLNRPVFFRVPPHTCPYGYGYGRKADGHYVQSCRDPFFSIAADAAAHHIGDVIFVPKLAGLKLPTGETHDGYLVVRDTGPDLNDRGSDFFAFFSGLELDNDPKNPFVRQMLDNYDFEFDYLMVDPDKAAAVLKARNFPGLPDSLTKEFYR